MTSFALATAVKDLRIRMRDPLGFALWLGIPLAIGGLLTLGVGGSSGPKPRAPLYIADHDETFVSKAISKAFEQGALGDLFDVQASDEAAARAKLDDDQGSALIVIPKGFAQALVDDRPTTLALIENPAQHILPGIVEQTLALLPDALFYLHRLIGPEIRAVFDQVDDDRGPTDTQVIAISMSIKRSIERVGKYLFPPVLELESPKRTNAGPSFDFGRAFFPSMLFMSLFFMAQGMAAGLWTEKTQGALRRLASSPRGFSSFLVGKWLACVALVVPVAIVGLGLGTASFGFEFARLPLAVLWLAMTMAMFYGIFAIIQVVSPSERAANVNGNMLLFPLMMIGGSFFPFEAMPEWMVSIGKWTPNGWALLGFESILDGKLGLAQLAQHFAIASAVSAVFLVAVLARIQRSFARS